MSDRFEELPPPLRPGPKTKFADDIALARDNPGRVVKIDGEHSTGCIRTLKRHGVNVRSRNGTRKGYVELWIWTGEVADVKAVTA